MWDRIRGAIGVGMDAWRNGSSGYQAFTGNTPASWARTYDILWATYTGDLFGAEWKRHHPPDSALYSNIRLMYSHVQSVVSFYETHVYMGSLSTNARRLPNGSTGAIPIEPQTGDETKDEALLNATAALWTRWNWQQGMSQRPLYGAALGVAFTEIVDDPARHTVWPKMVWPGYVVDLELDIGGNVKSYALEYQTTIVRSGNQVSGLYRKEVDKREYRFFFNDSPWSDRDGHGDAVQENPWGFVPAIWDQHRKINGDRGLPAMVGTKQAFEELNSILSHAMDYQNKAFAAPIGVKGGVSQDGGDKETKQGPQYLNLLSIPLNGGFDMLQFDVGKTLEIVEWLKKGITETNPEASFYHELRAMSQLSGTAVERALGDAVGRVTQARKGYDPNSVKLFQMSNAMCGHRLNGNDWMNPTKRDEVFRPYDLNSYTSGDLDMTIIGERGVVERTEEERIRIVQMKESLQFASSLEELGYSAEEAAVMITEREAAMLRRSNLMSGFGG